MENAGKCEIIYLFWNTKMCIIEECPIKNKKIPPLSLKEKFSYLKFNTISYQDQQTN